MFIDEDGCVGVYQKLSDPGLVWRYNKKKPPVFIIQDKNRWL